MSVGYGFFEAKEWARWIGIIINIASLILGIVEIASNPIIIAAIAKSLGILFYLLTRNVRVFFRMALPP